MFRLSSIVKKNLENKNSLFIHMYLSTHPYEHDAAQGQFLKQILTGLNSEFSFS